MNKLIKELAEHSKAWYPEGYPSCEGGDAAWMNLVIFDKQDLEKFAMLIVAECLDCILVWRDATDDEMEKDPHWQGYRSGCDDSIVEIQERFGD